jgi:hypothetical protein
MDGQHRAVVRNGLVLWKTKDLTCTCLTVAFDHIEICLFVGGLLISREVFTDANAATQYAIDIMHAYGGA